MDRGGEIAAWQAVTQTKEEGSFLSPLWSRTVIHIHPFFEFLEFGIIIAPENEPQKKKSMVIYGKIGTKKKEKKEKRGRIGRVTADIEQVRFLANFPF